MDCRALRKNLTHNSPTILDMLAVSRVSRSVIIICLKDLDYHLTGVRTQESGLLLVVCLPVKPGFIIFDVIPITQQQALLLGNRELWGAMVVNYRHRLMILYLNELIS